MATSEGDVDYRNKNLLNVTLRMYTYVYERGITTCWVLAEFRCVKIERKQVPWVF